MLKKLRYTIKNKLIMLLSYWRFFVGMFIGGILANWVFTMEELIKSGGVYIFIDKKDFYLWFIVGTCGIGIGIGAMLQDLKNEQIEKEKFKRNYYNMDKIFIGEGLSSEEKEIRKKAHYEKDCTIVHYIEELTPSQEKIIEKRNKEINKLKSNLNAN